MFDKTCKSMREAFGQALLELGQNNHNIVALSADVTESTKVNMFAEKYPHRCRVQGIWPDTKRRPLSGLARYETFPIHKAVHFGVGRPFREHIRRRKSSLRKLLYNVPA